MDIADKTFNPHEFGERVDLSPARWIWYPSQRTLQNTFVLFRKDFILDELPESAIGMITADSRYLLSVNGQRVQFGPAPSDPRWPDTDPFDITSLLRTGKNVIGVHVLFYGVGDGTWVTGKPGLLLKLDLNFASSKSISIVSDESWMTHLDRAHKPGQYKRWYLRALQEDFDARLFPFGWDRPEYGVSNKYFGFNENTSLLQNDKLDSNQTNYEKLSKSPDSIVKSDNRKFDWIPAMALECKADKPSICSNYSDYMYDSGYENKEILSIVKREIPLTREICIRAKRLNNAFLMRWLKNPLDWFDYRTPNSFEVVGDILISDGFTVQNEISDDEKKEDSDKRNINNMSKSETTASERTGDSNSYILHKTLSSELSISEEILTSDAYHFKKPFNPDESVVVTFEFAEQAVGWPFFTINTSEGTIIELMVQESHEPAKVKFMDNHFYAWTRFICKEGENRFETFDYESLRWMQLNVRNMTSDFAISHVGIRRRLFDWTNVPSLACSDEGLQQLFNASINTVKNAAIETIVDGMGRERQQYSGDVSHSHKAIRYGFGEYSIIKRFLSTFSEGVTSEGYLMDCWPAHDRMNRIAQRQVGLTNWGPILDHSVGFVFDCYHHYFQTGDKSAIDKPFQSILKICSYLESKIDGEGLLLVENLGIPTVWMDHYAYKKQKHKQCAFNLYFAAMLLYPLQTILEAFSESELALHYKEVGNQILESTINKYWCVDRKIYINNLPWVDDEKEYRLCDRSLSTALMYDLYPDGKILQNVNSFIENNKSIAKIEHDNLIDIENVTTPALNALIECPSEMGLSYPANSGWRYHALAKYGRADVVIKDFRTRWLKMDSVKLNNTLQEDWTAASDTTAQWSHIPVVPLYSIYMDIAGITPIKCGFEAFQIRPQIESIESLDLIAHTIKGEIHFISKKHDDYYELQITVPKNCIASLVLDEKYKANLKAIETDKKNKTNIYNLTADKVNIVTFRS